MKNVIPFAHFFYLMIIPFSFKQSNAMITDTNYVSVSQQLLYAVRTKDSSDAFIKILAGADKKILQEELSTDAKKKAFWLNIYNAFVQKLLTENPGKYKNRNSFFSLKQIVIAGKQLSLDDIEHGV